MRCMPYPLGEKGRTRETEEMERNLQGIPSSKICGSLCSVCLIPDGRGFQHLQSVHLFSILMIALLIIHFKKDLFKKKIIFV